MRRRVLRRVGAHGAEFINGERIFMNAYSLLLKQRRARRSKPYREQNQNQRRRKHKNQNQRKEKIDRAFDESVQRDRLQMNNTLSLYTVTRTFSRADTLNSRWKQKLLHILI